MTSLARQIHPKGAGSRITYKRAFADQPHLWVEGRKNALPKTSERAAQETQQRVRLLRRHGGTYQAEALADTLDPCAEGWRCESAACPECSRAFQRQFVHIVGRHSRKVSSQQHLVSIVSEEGVCALGDLSPERVQAFRRSVLDAIAACEIHLIAGGIDVNVNVGAGPEDKPYWILQAWILVERFTAEKKEALKAFFHSSNRVRTPVRAQKFDGDLRGIAYAMKNDFVRRESIERFQRPDGTWARRNTRFRKLHVDEAVELFMVLHDVGFRGRSLFPRCRSPPDA